MSQPEKPPQDAGMQLMQFITGHWVAAAVYAAAKLRLADHLADGPQTADELAAATGADGSSVYRLLRALASLGVFEETAARTFSLAEMGELLRSDHPRSMRSMALFQGAPPHWEGWGAFLHSVETGESAFEKVHGKGFFDYCQSDPEFAEAFNGAMTGMSAAASEVVVQAYDFSGIETLVDVGGGHGYLLACILRNNPDLRGKLIDLPHVVKGSAPAFDVAGLSDRVELVGGDFFETVPSGDAYIAKHIIHDWDDEHCIVLLTNMRKAMSGNGRVLLVEAVIPPGNAPSLAKLLDLEMLHSTHGGRERSEGEFAELFAAAGLKLNRIVPTASYFSVVEAIPAD